MINDHSKSEAGRIKLAPWLSVDNAEKAIGFYQAAFGVSVLYRLNGEDGKPDIAQFSISGAEFWVQEDPENSPLSTGNGSVRMIVTVDDPDSLFVQAVSAGATVIVPMHEGHGWRVGRIEDPFGHHWEIGKLLVY